MFTIGKKSRSYEGMTGTGQPTFETYSEAFKAAKSHPNPVGYDVYMLEDGKLLLMTAQAVKARNLEKH